MSWILGFIGASLSPAMRERLVALHPAALRVAEDSACYLATGGLPETCHAESLSQDKGAWAVVGLGIRLHHDHCTFLDTASWQTQLEQSAFDASALDGHFVAVRYQKGRLDCFTDATGTRTLYFAAVERGMAFSTRLDWLARLQGNADIDFAVFGSHWLSLSQWSTESLVEGIERLGPGGHLVYTSQGLERHEKSWLPEINESDADGTTFAQVLTALTHPDCSDGRVVSLGLSGGLDSRLALAMRMDEQPVHTHTFGPDDLPDAHIARRIAAGERLHHLAMHAPVPDVDTCLSLLRAHMGATQAISTASAVLGLRYFPTLHQQDKILMDGGMGEITRRKFLNRLLLFNRRALRKGDTDAMLRYIRFPRADFFNQDVAKNLEKGLREQVASMWDHMPDPQVVGEENFLDLLRIRTYLPNFYGYEQNRLDGVIQNFMPFSQPSLLSAVFQVPLALRRHGRLVRQLIRSRDASLTRYPLVKGGFTHPFWLPALPAAVWTKVQARLGGGYTNTTRLAFLEEMKPFVLDAMHTEAVRTYAGYDTPRLIATAEAFYAGKTELAITLDWWLAFEMWRRSLRE